MGLKTVHTLHESQKPPKKDGGLDEDLTRSIDQTNKEITRTIQALEEARKEYRELAKRETQTEIRLSLLKEGRPIELFSYSEVVDVNIDLRKLPPSEQQVRVEAEIEKLDEELGSLSKQGRDSQLEIKQIEKRLDYLSDKMDFERRLISLYDHIGFKLYERSRMIMNSITEKFDQDSYMVRRLVGMKLSDVRRYLHWAILNEYDNSNVYFLLAKSFYLYYIFNSGKEPDDDTIINQAIEYCYTSESIDNTNTRTLMLMVDICDERRKIIGYEYDSEQLIRVYKQKLRALGVHIADKGNII